MLASPGAIAIALPFCTIHWYGIILAFAFLIGLIVAVQITKKEYNNKQTVNNIYEIIFYALICGILGARIYYVLLSFDYYSMNLSEIIMINHGGLSIHGGILGGIAGMILCCQKYKLNFFQYADILALSMPVAQSIGRWGNFFNSEAFGLPTNLPFGVYIPVMNRPEAYKLYEYFHPTFLYESILDILIFCILFFVIKKFFFDKTGVIFFSYLILYSICRIFVEMIRIDSVLNILNIPVAIWISGIIILTSVCCLIKLLRNRHIG